MSLSQKKYMPEQVLVVVGGGLAGMSAAIEAYNSNPSAQIVLVDKEQRLGGNSAKASSGINGVGTETQKKLQVADSIPMFFDDVVKSGKGFTSPTLAQKLVDDSKDAVTWLQTAFNLDLDVLAQLGGHSAKRTHRRPDLPDGRPQPVGYGITSTLGNHLSKLSSMEDGRLKLILNSRVTSLIKDESDGVVGVIYSTLDPNAGSEQSPETHLLSKAVILTTGGFAGEGPNFPPILSKYAPSLVGLPSTNGHFATGDGLKLAVDVGAQLVDMDKVQVHPTGFLRLSDPNSPTKFLAAEALRGEGGILLNGLGHRFVNELGTRDAVTDSISANCANESSLNLSVLSPNTPPESSKSPNAFLVLSEPAATKFGLGALGFYVKMGLMFKSDSLSQLASSLHVDVDTLKLVFTEYESARAGLSHDKFGKTQFPSPLFNDQVDTSVLKSPNKAKDSPLGENTAYYWGIITPVLHYTMGGVRFNNQAQVLRQDGTAIPVTGGLHGANRLGGNSLLECVVYGREAARQASKLII
ncbi:Fumarate reductase 2 [Smittium mucronatum]|uniref:Fumarate reductase n=1 Tax=Smittium mucronatum TaxID=133383 RepID=A0A1R0H499_9FUNG|nr:Fumarate reductase 2 [Smittium mucronatum]